MKSHVSENTGIQLTQDEIIGDINTGKKIPIKTILKVTIE